MEGLFSLLQHLVFVLLFRIFLRLRILPRVKVLPVLVGKYAFPFSFLSSLALADRDLHSRDLLDSDPMETVL